MSFFYTWYGPPHHLHPSSQWSCPFPGFRLMTSDSPLRGASCLQSAVRLLVIIFQSVTLVSASWRWERREDGGPGWLAGWLAGWVRRRARGGERVWCLVVGSVVFMCVYVCRLKWRWWVDDTGCHCTLVFASWPRETPVSVLKRPSAALSAYLP